MKAFHFLAFDIGATSGRAVLGSLQEGLFTMREIHRFPSPMVALHGRYYWNVFNLYSALLEALSKCAAEQIPLCSIGIDTWGVDFGYLANDGTLLGMPRAYRDPYTEGAPEDFFTHLPKREVYARTGIQVLPFNSLFQFYRTYQDVFVPQEIAERILFMPDLLTYMLTEQQVCEYTIASTSQLLNPYTHKFDYHLLEQVGVSPTQFGQLVMPGTTVGPLCESVCQQTGMRPVPVIAVAGHDTASAVAAVPARSPHFAYLSSGTWSLMGIETEQPIITDESFAHNFTNEGGIEGTTRFLKNITGMWLLERCRATWKKQGKVYSYEELTRMAKESTFDGLINPDDASFANPEEMMAAIATYCQAQGNPVPQSDADYVRCIFRSLAHRYGEVLTHLKTMSPFPIECLHVIGGGSQNELLNQWTADAIGMPVIAGPSEATAIGNCFIQAKAAGLVGNRWEMRKLIAETFTPKVYYPSK
ncbi:MAG: rhamnulokinase [Parabacteroides sp.]|nr:rhamnulokinase [Parabacteroides sp.]